ncbi:MAG: PIN domain-containing protein [Acidobacteria bacterium]|nr:PIN domain-containing protein [Acidobacteriota bacterium]
MAERYLLDTSAILALTDREAGWDTVAALLEDAAAGECLIECCAASLMELYYLTLQEQNEQKAAQLVGAVKTWPVSWIYPDEKIFLLAGRIKALHKLSFAGALIAAVAVLHDATLVHKDPEIEALAGELAQLTLPWKPKRH